MPAGGAGTRLWPLSRPARPKFLLPGPDGVSLLRATVDRCAALADDVYVVTGAAHADAVDQELPELARDRIVVEPSPRDSMPAIALAAALAEREDPGCVVASFPADHVITDGPALARAVATAVHAAGTADRLVTIGLEPTGPSTAFGYIDVGGELADVPGAHRAGRFVEKPDADTAHEYLAAGTYRWNAGMFVARAGVLLDLLADQLPGLAAGVRRIAAADGAERAAELERTWPTLTRIAIDHALAEPLAPHGMVAVVPADLGWDDIGDLLALARHRPLRTTDAGRTDGPGHLIGVDADVTVLGGTGRTVAVAGVRGLVVVDTGDVLALVDAARTQDVRHLAALAAGLDPPRE